MSLKDAREKRIKVLYETIGALDSAEYDEIVPSFSYGAGILYPSIVKVSAQYGVPEGEILEELTRLGVLEKEYHDSLVICPFCGSIRLFSKLRCPHCNSDKLVRILILAHVTCGGMNIVEESEQRPACTKCGKPLTNTSTVGSLYQCRNCGARFETPLPAWKCASCDRLFDHRNARYMLIHKFRVKREAAQQVAKQLLVTLAKESISSMGFTVDVAAQVKGKSGYPHTVDLVVRGGGELLQLDIISDSPRAMSEALSSIAKSTDLEGEHHVFIPKSLEKSEAISGPRVSVYESVDDLLKKIEQLVGRLKSKKR